MQLCVDDNVHCQPGLREPGEADGCGLIKKEQNLPNPARECFVQLFFRDDKTPRVPVGAEFQEVWVVYSEREGCVSVPTRLHETISAPLR